MTLRRRRYPTDLTDAEWQLLARSSPLPSRAAAHPSMTAGSWSMPWPIGYGPAAPGGCCPMTYRPGRPSTTTSAAGGSRRCGNRSTACCASRSGSGRAGGPRPARRSWTAKASRPPNGGRHGYDGAKKVNGRKRHLLVDTLGLVIKVHMTAADVGDRDGAAALLRSLDRRRFPRLRHGWADGGYRGPFLDWAAKHRGIAFQVVQRRDGGRQRRWLPPGATPPIVAPFAVAPRRWVVERTFAWLGRYRRLSKDYEYLTATSEAVIYLAMTRLLVRRLTRP